MQPAHPPTTRLTTNQLADALGVKGSTVRRSLCVRGHYLGVRPVKLPNGRLLWPLSEVERLIDPSSAKVKAQP